MAELLHIQTLGRFRVRHGDESIPDKAWGTHRAKALLKLLITHNGQSLTRDFITEQLWPDAMPGAAVKALHTAVSDLRRVLEPALERRAKSMFIGSTDDGYQFNPDSSYTLDTLLFTQQIARARQHSESNALEAAVQAYAQAESLYAGDYLPDDLYAEWSIGARERLRGLLLTMLIEAAGAQAQLGRYRQAVANCRRVLELDNCQEEAYRLLMYYYYAAGEQAQALRVYDECVVTLERELGVQPMPMIETLAVQIRARQVAEIDDRPIQAFALPEMRYSLSQMPFVGRAAERAQIRQIVERAAAGQSGLLLVLGEAGVGKSSLVEVALGLGGGGSVLHGQAHELTASLPYHPLAEVIRHAMREGLMPPSARAWTAQAARLVPELDTSVTTAQGDLRPVYEDKTHLFDALRHCFLDVSVGGTIVLEDIQWADEGTLEFLAYLAPHMLHSRTLIIATCRPAERLKPLLGRAGRDPWLNVLRLKPLAEQDTVELVARLAVRAPGVTAFGRRLYRATGGNPLFTAGVLARLFETGQLWRDTAGQWQGVLDLAAAPVLPVPDEVEDLVAQRTRGLGPVASRLLSSIAVIEEGADATLLQTVYGDTNLSEAALLDALDELLDADLLGTTTHDTVRIQHDAVRAAIYARLSAPRRQRLHAAVGAVLERRAASSGKHDQADSVLGEHFFRGAVWDKAATYLFAAGNAAADLYAYAEARLHYERALSSLEQAPANEELRMLRVDTLLRYDYISYLVEPSQRRLERLAAAEHLAQRISGREGITRLIQLHIAQGRTHANRCNYPAARDYYTQALAEAESLQDSELLIAPRTQLAILAFLQGRFGEAAPQLARALAPLERRRDWNDWLTVTLFMAMAAGMRGYTAAAIVQGQRALARAQAAKHLTGVTQTHCALCIIHFMAGDHESTLQAGEAAVETAGASGDVMLAWIALRMRAWSLMRMGDQTAAQPLLTEAQIMSERFDGALLFADWFAVADAKHTLLIGDPILALRQAQATAEEAERTGSIFAEGMAQRVWGQALAQRGAPVADAEAHLAESVRLLTISDARLEIARTQVASGLLWRDQNSARATEYFKRASVQFAASGNQRELAAVRHWLAEGS